MFRFDEGLKVYLHREPVDFRLSINGLQVGDERLAGAAFCARVEAMAAGLLANGLRSGDRIAILLPRSVAEAVVLLAVAVAGGIAVPIHGRLKDQQVAHVLADCEPFAVVTSAVRALALADAPGTLRSMRTFTVGGPVPGVVSERLPSGDASSLRLPASDAPAYNR